MSRYRKKMTRTADNEPLDGAVHAKKLVISRLTVISVGAIVALGVVLLLFNQIKTKEEAELLPRSFSETWFKEKDFHEAPQLTYQQLENISNLISINEIWKTLNQILVVRTPGSKAHSRVQRHIIEELQKYNWNLEVDRFTAVTPYHPKKDDITFTNIIATWNPQASRKLVLACHYESKIKPSGFLGATDSAVPCAMMMEVARVLGAQLKKQSDKQKSVSIKRPDDLTLQLIFFDGEEAFEEWSENDSLYGSRHLAELWSKTPYREDGKSVLNAIDLLVLLDLIGTSTTSFANFDKTFTRWYSVILEIERKMIFKKYLSRGARERFLPRQYSVNIEDDHIPFLKRNVSIMHLISVPFPKEWHTIDDNANALNNDTITDVTKIVAAFVAQYLKLSDL